MSEQMTNKEAALTELIEFYENYCPTSSYKEPNLKRYREALTDHGKAEPTPQTVDAWRDAHTLGYNGTDYEAGHYQGWQDCIDYALAHGIASRGLLGTVPKSDIEGEIMEAAACMLLPNNGLNDTVWLNDHITLYEHLIGLTTCGDEMTGDPVEDYKRLTGREFPQPKTQNEKG